MSAPYAQTYSKHLFDTNKCRCIQCGMPHEAFSQLQEHVLTSQQCVAVIVRTYPCGHNYCEQRDRLGGIPDKCPAGCRPGDVVSDCLSPENVATAYEERLARKNGDGWFMQPPRFGCAKCQKFGSMAEERSRGRNIDALYCYECGHMEGRPLRMPPSLRPPRFDVERVRQAVIDAGYEPAPRVCDCGALKARTTHASWCSAK